MKPSRKLYFGWPRDCVTGDVTNWHEKTISNTITCSTAFSGTQRPIVSEIYEMEQ